MKVLFVIDGLGTGGAERSLAELLPYLDEAGFAFLVCCLYRRRPGVHDDLERRGYDVRLLRGRGILSRALDLRRIVHRERPDLVHTTILGANLVGRLAAAGTGVPVLTSLVSVPYSVGRLKYGSTPRWKVAALRIVDGWTARHLTSHLHAISRAVQRAAETDLRIPAERITVIERGRDPVRLGEPGSERKARARAALGLASEDEVLVAVGRHVTPKGHRYLLEAIPMLARDRPRLVTLLTGRTDEASKDLEAMARRLDLDRHVRFLGHRDDIPDVLAAADVFVFPSLWEGLGGALIEAMALGLPIVASDLEAVREVVEEGENAVLVPPADPNALAAAVASILDDPARRRAFGEAGRRRFEERFTAERSSRRMVELYRRLARKAGWPSGS